MARCDTCGNEYDKTFQLTMDGNAHTFDSFECAIHMLAPSCTHCGCKILGHGLEAPGQFFCCAQCASHSGNTQMRDRADSRQPM